VRYASNGDARTLYHSADAESIRHLHPENERFQRLSEDDRLVVSEPFSDLPGVWAPVPQATGLTVRRGGVLEQRPFAPA
jgi:glutamine amidotransferase